jgi:hypothetical protein
MDFSSKSVPCYISPTETARFYMFNACKGQTVSWNSSETIFHIAVAAWATHENKLSEA